MTDLLLGLPTPTPEALRAARGDLTQVAAAAACGLSSALRWSEYERGVRTIELSRWAVFLLATGQHPGGRFAPAGRAGRGEAKSAA